MSGKKNANRSDPLPKETVSYSISIPAFLNECLDAYVADSMDVPNRSVAICKALKFFLHHERVARTQPNDAAFWRAYYKEVSE